MSEVVPFPFLWYGAVCVTYVLTGTVGSDSCTSLMLFEFGLTFLLWTRVFPGLPMHNPLGFRGFT